MHQLYPVLSYQIAEVWCDRHPIMGSVSDEETGDVMYNTEEDVRVNIIEAACVGIVGTGSYGRALASKLEWSGLQVIIGSREPQGKCVSVETALQESVIVLAVPMFSWVETPLDRIAPGTVVIDCSNRHKSCSLHQLSQAETLQQMLPPGVHVVKALNTISAYEMENQTVSGRKEIPIAGNDKAGKEAVVKLLDKLGYHGKDMGCLEKARLIENIPLALFPNWRKPFFISLALWILFYVLTFCRYHLVSSNELGWHPHGLKNIFVKYINKACDCHALVLLAACYLPGVLAAYIQLGRGTKYSEFPAWLANWLQMRKQLGVLMLLSASVHVCFYLLLYKPHYTHQHLPTPANTEWDWSRNMTVQGEAVSPSVRTNMYLGAGVIAYFTAVVLGITSLPSVSSSLSWNEFRLLQSLLGWFCLLLSTAHCALDGWENLYSFNKSVFLDNEQVPLILPAVTILLKIPLLLPGVHTRLAQIRQGRVF